MKNTPKPGQWLSWTDNTAHVRSGLVIKIDEYPTDTVLMSPGDTAPGDTVWVDRALLF